jgi:hypothetical protein
VISALYNEYLKIVFTFYEDDILPPFCDLFILYSLGPALTTSVFFTVLEICFSVMFTIPGIPIIHSEYGD